MQVLGVREALGGRWAANFRGWLILLPPTAALVFVQEASTRFSSPEIVLLSVLSQHVAAGVLVLLLAGMLRKWHAVLPLWACFSIWGAAAVGRGIAGGLVAGNFSTSDPDFAFRIISWLAISSVWMPLLVYLLAQLDYRRTLLRGLGASIHRRDEARLRAARSSEEIREELITAVVTTVGPVVDDIRLSLRAATGKISEQQLRAISDRLKEVSAETARTIERLSLPPDPTPEIVPRRSPPFAAVLDFERSRLRSSLVTGLALLALFVPVSLGLAQAPVSLAAVTALCGTAAALAIGQLLPRTRGRTGMQQDLRLTVARYAFAALTGSVILVAFAVDTASSFGGLLAALLPFSLLFSSATVWSAVGVSGANLASIDALESIDEETRRWAEAAAEDENTIRGQLSVLMHGPIQGRLAACAMALNFHAAEAGTADSDKTQLVTNAVLDHLDAASGDLDSLSVSGSHVR